jgi:crotonobetainyl-CoA:carnitine CoA-transferase CaiB-like acyl-CoA transferase
MPAPVPKLSATPGAVRWSGGRIGAHNKEVFEGLLGLNSMRVARLRREEVI